MRLCTACLAAVLLGCTPSDGPDSIDYGADATPTASTSDSTAPTVPVDPLEGIGQVEMVSEGYAFTEGPTWREAEGVLLFSDIPNARIHRLTPPKAVDVFDAASGNSNGLDSDVDGSLLVAEHGNRRVTRRDAKGAVVDAIDDHEGNALNSPNDLAVRSDGTLYFTDPPYGLEGRPREIAFNGLFRVAPGTTTTVAEWEGDADATRPNGLALSPDESRLYMADTQGGVLVFDVATDGSLSKPRPFTNDVQNGDGMAMDRAGNLYVTAADGVRVFAPDGTRWGTVTLPDQPANCAFGDADHRTLYITARSRLYRVRLAHPGLL